MNESQPVALEERPTKDRQTDNLDVLAAAFATAGNTTAGALIKLQKDSELPQVACGGSYL